jgi:hypothetical protein
MDAMSDTSPHIRHRVQLPDGKHVEIVYRDHRRSADRAGRSNPGCPSEPASVTDGTSATIPPPSTAAAQNAAETSSAPLSPSATAPAPSHLSPPAAMPSPAPTSPPATIPPSAPIPPAPVLPPAAAAPPDPAAATTRAPAGESSDSASALEPAAQPEPLHVCFNCGGELVYPLDWIEEGERHWRIILRCPECEAYREGVFEQAIVERLDDELDRATGELLSDLRQITHANMTDEIEFFVRALEADVIVPADFRP